MKHCSSVKAAVAVLLMMICVGCTTTAHRQQTEAGRRIGAAAAQVQLEEQPDECGKLFADLHPRQGEGPQSVLKRYIEYVRGPINGRIARCFQFNEDQRVGLVGR
jgi:hypothetical protein